MNEKCPVCNRLSVTLKRVHQSCSGHYIYHADYSYYYCTKCGWLCNPHTVEILEKLSIDLEPNVVYILELINRNTMQHGICLNCNLVATWSLFYRSARGALSLFYCPDCNSDNIAGSCSDINYFREISYKHIRSVKLKPYTVIREITRKDSI